MAERKRKTPPGGSSRPSRPSRLGSDTYDVENSSKDSENSWNAQPTYNSKMLVSMFSIGRIIGTGTFGTVRIAKNTRTKKSYALKIYILSDMVRQKQTDHILRARYLFEDLDHEFLIKVHGSYKDDRYLYFYTDIYNGGEFFVHMKKIGVFEDKEARIYISQVILALEYLHGRDIMYRELVPENILLDREGHLKLCGMLFCKKLPLEALTYTLVGTTGVVNSSQYISFKSGSRERDPLSGYGIYRED